MNRVQDPLTRAIETWLATEQDHEDAAAVLDRVVAQLDATPQGQERWSAGIFRDLTAYARFAVASAVVVVVTIIAINLLSGLNTGGHAVTSSPSTAATEAPAATLSMPTSAYPGDPPGPGTHRVIVDGIPFSFEMPPGVWGWESHDPVYLSKSTEGPQGAEAIIVWTTLSERSTAGSAYRPCFDLLGSPVDRSADGLTDAVSAVSGIDVVSGPSDVSIGGHSAKQVSLFLTYSVLDSSLWCGPGFFLSWDEDVGGAMWDATIPGDTIKVWIVEVDGTVLFIEAVTHWNAGPDVAREIQSIVESIQFE